MAAMSLAMAGSVTVIVVNGAWNPKQQTPHPFASTMIHNNLLHNNYLTRHPNVQLSFTCFNTRRKQQDTNQIP
jgi:hypothetical protein